MGLPSMGIRSRHSQPVSWKWLLRKNKEVIFCHLVDCYQKACVLLLMQRTGEVGGFAIQESILLVLLCLSTVFNISKGSL